MTGIFAVVVAPATAAVKAAVEVEVAAAAAAAEELARPEPQRCGMGCGASYIGPGVYRLRSYGHASGVQALRCVADLGSHAGAAAVVYLAVAGEGESAADAQETAGTGKQGACEVEAYVDAGASPVHAAAGGGAELEARAAAGKAGGDAAAPDPEAGEIVLPLAACAAVEEATLAVVVAVADA